MEQKIRGYIVAHHIFGRSRLIRHANSYSLEWQRKQSVLTVGQTFLLTEKMYGQLKDLLLPVELSVISSLGDNKGNMIEYHHKASSRNYMRVKRFLIKNKIIGGTK